MTNILLIEDNEIDRFIAERQLALSGLNAAMQSVTDGEAALKLLLNQFLQTGFLPDVILVDCFMPVMNGLEFIKAFEEGVDMVGKEHVRVFLVTSLADPKLCLDPARYRIAGIIEKPITPESLNNIVLRAGNRSDVQFPKTPIRLNTDLTSPDFQAGLPSTDP